MPQHGAAPLTTADLQGNLLFYYKVNEYGGVCAGEPAGVFVMEDCLIETEDEACLPFSFSVTFHAEPDRKHMFSSSNQTSADEWVRVLKNASYEGLRQRVRQMQSELQRLTGKDPLLGFPHFAEY